MLRACRTSTASSIFITPGCRSVRSFLRAFLASGNRDLVLGLISKEKMLQLEPSSFWRKGKLESARHSRQTKGATYSYTSCAIVKSPYRLVHIYTIAKRVGERWPLCNGRSHCRLKEIHALGKGVSLEILLSLEAVVLYLTRSKCALRAQIFVGFSRVGLVNDDWAARCSRCHVAFLVSYNTRQPETSM